MPRLIWTPPALQDVARLNRFVAPKNPDAGRSAIRAMTRQNLRSQEACGDVEWTRLPAYLESWPLSTLYYNSNDPTEKHERDLRNPMLLGSGWEPKVEKFAVQ